MSKLALEVERLVREMREGKTASSAPQEATKAARPRASARRARPRRSPAKAAKRAKEVAVIDAVRAEVFRLDRQCICGACLPSKTDEMHEIVPRSKTRGRPPEERFSVQNCVRLSRACHRKVTGDIGGKKLEIECLSPQGAMGPIAVKSLVTGRTRVYRR